MIYQKSVRRYDVPIMIYLVDKRICIVLLKRF